MALTATLALAPLGAAAVQVEPGEKEIDLSSAMDAHWDRSGTLELGALGSVPFGPPSARAQPFFARGALWIRVELENASDESLTRFLAFDDPLLERIDVWLRLPMGEIHRQGGYGVPAASRTIEMRGPWHELPLVMLPGERMELIARLESPGPVFARARLCESGALGRDLLSRIVRQGFHLGTLFAVAVINLYSFLALRERVHLTFLGLTLSYAGFEVAETGLMAAFFARVPSRVIATAPPLFASMAIYLALRFSEEFLPARARVAARVVSAACLAAGAVALVSPRAGHLAAAVAGAAALPLLLSRAVAAARGGSRAGRFLAVALAPLLPAALLYGLTAAGLVPEPLGGRHLVHIAFTVTGFVVAFALADRVRAADEDARARLGLAVEERTMELATTVEALRREADDRRRAEAARRESEERLRHAQRIEAIGRLAGGIAHDYNNLLTSVSTNVSILRMDPQPPAEEQREILQDVAEAVSRGAALTRQLLVFSRRQVLSPQPLAVNRVVEGLRRLLDRLIGENYRLHLDLSSGLPSIVADAAQLEQVVMNLVLNARDAMAGGGTIRIGTKEVEIGPADAAERGVAPGRFVRLSVADSGPGIPPEVLSHVFEPFFTTKPEGKGTGLGLATVHGVASQHGGFVDVDPGPGRGAAFHVHLPVGDAGAIAGAAGPGRLSALPRGDETILLVEDDTVMREATGRLLSRLGYRVIPAHDAAEALRVCEAEGGPDLVIADLVMPGMDGLALSARIRETCPAAAILIVSGHGHDVLAEHRVDAKDLPFLGKPYSPEALAERIRELLDGRKAAATGSSA